MTGPTGERRKEERKRGAYVRSLGSLVSIGARGVAHVPVCNPNCLLTNTLQTCVHLIAEKRFTVYVSVGINQWRVGPMQFIFLFMVSFIRLLLLSSRFIQIVPCFSNNSILEIINHFQKNFICIVLLCYYLCVLLYVIIY